MKNKWVPLLTSIGVGAATYYTMSRRNSGIGQAFQNMLPLVSQMGSGQGSK